MKRVGAVCVLLSAVLLAACGNGNGDDKESSSERNPSSSQNSRPVSADLVATDAGFADGSVYAYIENRENREIAVKPGFILYDGDTKLDYDAGLGSYVMQPNSSTFVSTSVTVESISRVEANPEVEVKANLPEHADGALEASVSGVGQRTVHVAVKNMYPQDVNSFELALVCKDAAGKPIHLINSEIAEVKKGATINEDFNVGSEVASKAQSCEAFPHIRPNTLFFD
ncbi:MAG: hypothetical protein HOQ05_07115 [Corynebacteriales bacterium]|nr:hypothetical protein [Mycobacteriales bacterium]